MIHAIVAMTFATGSAVGREAVHLGGVRKHRAVASGPRHAAAETNSWKQLTYR
jgi:hypothetical protein